MSMQACGQGQSRAPARLTQLQPPPCSPLHQRRRKFGRVLALLAAVQGLRQVHLGGVCGWAGGGPEGMQTWQLAGRLESSGLISGGLSAA